MRKERLRLLYGPLDGMELMSDETTTVIYFPCADLSTFGETPDFFEPTRIRYELRLVDGMASRAEDGSILFEWKGFK